MIIQHSAQDAIFGISDRDFDKLDSFPLNQVSSSFLLCFLFTRSRCIKTRLRQIVYLYNLGRYAVYLMQFALKCDLRKSQDFIKRLEMHDMILEIDNIMFFKSLKKIYFLHKICAKFRFTLKISMYFGKAVRVGGFQEIYLKNGEFRLD